MEEKLPPVISRDDIVIRRDVIPLTGAPVTTVTESGMLKALRQDYTVDGPKPKCDGWD